MRACLAQLAERKTEDLEVAGSTPAAGSQNFFVFGKEDNLREHVVNNCKIERNEFITVLDRLYTKGKKNITYHLFILKILLILNIIRRQITNDINQ